MPRKSPSRPSFRPAQPISLASLRRAVKENKPEVLHLALIDGCRALDAAKVYPIAFNALTHRSRKVRWAALFALEYMSTETAGHVLDDDQPVHRFAIMAQNDPDAEVRWYAIALLKRLVLYLGER